MKGPEVVQPAKQLLPQQHVERHSMARLLTKKEAFDFLRCSPRTFDRWRSLWRAKAPGPTVMLSKETGPLGKIRQALGAVSPCPAVGYDEQILTLGRPPGPRRSRGHHPAARRRRKVSAVPHGALPVGSVMATALGTKPSRGTRTGRGARLPSPLAAVLALAFASAANAQDIRRVLVLYPVSDGQPGILRFDEGLRSALKARPNDRVEIHNEYLDSARFPGEGFQGKLAEFLREKNAGRRPDVVIPALAPSLDFVLKYREEIFPGVPVVFGAIERREVEARRLGPGVVGVPMTVDLAGTLGLALRLHPGTRRVFVVAGRSKTDAYWVAEARRAFRGYEGTVQFVYLTGLPLNDLLREVAKLPERSVIYYLHLFEDGLGETFVPADVAGLLSSAANAPV